MKRIVLAILCALSGATTVAVPVAVVACSGCASPSHVAATNVLLPAMKLAATGLAEDAERGVAAALAAGEISGTEAAALRSSVVSMRAALDPLDAAALAAWWTIVRPMAERGIVAQLAAGAIGPLGAESARERVRMFGEGVAALR